MKIFEINKIYIHSFSLEELIQNLSDILSSPQKPQIITTFNLDFLRITEQDNDFMNVCKNSLWNLPDGNGITSLIRLKYKKKIQRITGNDIFPILLKIANDNKYRIALIGSTDDVLEIVREKLEKNYNKMIDNLLLLSPPINFEKVHHKNDEIVNKIIFFQPDIVLAAMGCPRQEIWLSNHMDKFNSKINLGVGAVFDYYSGIKRRSPLTFQKLGMEWIWRLVNEPKRLIVRYLWLDLPFYIKLSIYISINKVKSYFYKH